MRVLIVSEDPRERQRVTTALSLDDGVELVEVGTALEARAIVDRGGADVLVIDGDLTPKGGFSLLYEVRANADLEQRPQLPAIVLVQRANDAWLAGWARADATLPKPVDPFALAKLVQTLSARPTPEAV